jgi:hypothetical protein
MLICSGHSSHMSLEFLLLCKKRGFIVIWRLLPATHITQGKDEINFACFEGLISIQTSHAARQKNFLQTPYIDIDA